MLCVKVPHHLLSPNFFLKKYLVYAIMGCSRCGFRTSLHLTSQRAAHLVILIVHNLESLKTQNNLED